jgi:hypothetical protein
MGSAASTDARRVRQAQLARELGVTRQSINELVKRGVLPEDGDGLIDVELARVALANRVRPSSKTAAALGTAVIGADGAPLPAAAPAPAAVDTSTTSYHVAKTLREATEAKIAQLKLAELSGELIRVADVRSAYAKRAAGLREALLQLPSRLAPVMAAESDQARCYQLLEQELHEVLQQITEPDGGAA